MRKYGRRRGGTVSKNLGYEVTEHLVRTGVRGDKKITDGPNLTVIGELDAIGCKSHPMADSVTGVAHACGHHAQMAAMIGCAIALADPEIQKELGGSLSFLAVPAEEYIDADKRACLRQEGIEFCCGKSEMIRTGVFDDTDIALTTHVHMVPVERIFTWEIRRATVTVQNESLSEARPHTGRSIRGTVSTPSASRPARSR